MLYIIIITSQNGVTALIVACTTGNTDTVKALLTHGAVVNHCEMVKDLEHEYYSQYTLNYSTWSY